MASTSSDFEQPDDDNGGGEEDEEETETGIFFDESLQFLSFNQNGGCFAVGTDSGFRIFNSDPFRETFRRDFNGGGVGIVEMLFRCNILALVGGGALPKYSPNKVMIWDDHQSRCIGELSFRVPVRAVKLRRDKIVVVLEHKIYVYNFSDLKIVAQTDTFPNPDGIVSLSPTQDACVKACPGLNRGQVRLELYDRNETRFISAHDSPLRCISLSFDGQMIATASEKGTLVRVFDCLSGHKLHEFRRGTDQATIYSLAFSAKKDWLVCTSDKGTVHLYRIPSESSSINKNDSSSTPRNLRSNGKQAPPPSPLTPKSPSSMLQSMISMGVAANVPGAKYLQAERSFAQFRMDRGEGGDSATDSGESNRHAHDEFHDNTFRLCKASFSTAKENRVIVICTDGSYHALQFDPINGGPMDRVDFDRFGSR